MIDLGPEGGGRGGYIVGEGPPEKIVQEILDELLTVEGKIDV